MSKQSHIIATLSTAAIVAIVSAAFWFFTSGKTVNILKQNGDETRYESAEKQSSKQNSQKVLEEDINNRAKTFERIKFNKDFSNNKRTNGFVAKYCIEMKHIETEADKEFEARWRFTLRMMCDFIQNCEAGERTQLNSSAIKHKRWFESLHNYALTISDTYYERFDEKSKGAYHEYLKAAELVEF